MILTTGLKSLDQQDLTQTYKIMRTKLKIQKIMQKMDYVIDKIEKQDYTYSSFIELRNEYDRLSNEILTLKQIK